jgi:hypothetical protein
MRFCGKCGAPVDENPIEPAVLRELERIVTSRFKDQKVIEVETSQAILSRLAEWAKLFAWFAAIPLALLGSALGFLGIRTYVDFSSRVNSAREEALRPLAQTKIEAERIAQAYKDLSAQLESTRALSAQVATIGQKVTQLEQAVKFKQSSSLTPDMRKNLQDTFEQFYAYLKKIGFAVERQPPSVSVSSSQGLNAWYLPAKNEIYISPELVGFPFVVLREFAHHALTVLNRNALAPGLTGLESGLADYYPSSFGNDSDFGVPALNFFRQKYPGVSIPNRDLNNQRSFNELKGSSLSAQEQGTIWGGALWELRQRAGQSVTDRILIAAWKNLGTDSSAFPAELIRQDKAANSGANTAKIQEVFSKRGLKL